MHEFLPQVCINSRFRSKLTLSGRVVEGESSPTPSPKLPESYGIREPKRSSTRAQRSSSPPQSAEGMHISLWLSGAEEEMASPSPPLGPARVGVRWGIPGRRPPTSPSHAGACLGPRSRGPVAWSLIGQRVRPTETANNSKNSLCCVSLLFRLRGCRRPSISAAQDDPLAVILGLTAISAARLRSVRRRGGAMSPRSSRAQPEGWAPLTLPEARNSRAGKFASRSIAGGGEAGTG